MPSSCRGFAASRDLIAPAFRRHCLALPAALALCLAMWLGPTVTLHGQEEAPARRPVAERKPLIVGVTVDSYPYGYTDNRGHWSGYAADLLDAVARVMHLELRRESAPSSDLHRRFRSGEYDFLQAFSETAERRNFAEFSVPYLTLQGAIFVRARNSPIQRLEDFDGRPFAIIGAESIGEKFLRDHALTPRRVPVSSAEAGLRAVERGECDGVFVSHLTAASVIERVGLKNIQMFGQPLAGYDIRHCFAVHKGDAELLARLNEGLAILNRTGEFGAIYRRWFGHVNAPLVTKEQFVGYVAAALAVAFLAALWGFLRQRTLRKRIAGQAAEIAANEALLQALYDNIPMALGVIEDAPDGPHLTAINRPATAYFGSAGTTGPGVRLSDLGLPAEWSALLADVLGRWPAEGTLLREECELPQSRRHLVVTLVPLPAASASARRRICLLVEDVSERHQLDEELGRSRKLRAVGELVGGIAHEFNNLLTPVILRVSELQVDWAHDTALQGELKVIHQAARRAAELTRRLLTFGRKAEAHPEVIHLHAVVAGNFDLLRQTVDRRIAWINAIPPELPPLFLNVTDLNQILLNLLINARDTLSEKLALRAGGWEPAIRVEAATVDAATIPRSPNRGPRAPLGWQRVTVRDNGLGMMPAVRERIFEPFFTTKEVGQGTGLGLATVWHLVNAFGGAIEVESTPDVGSAFHVFLPVWPPPPPPAESAPAASALPLRPLRVLVVEDDSQVAAVVCSAVRRGGHQVEHLPDGSAAWRRLETGWPDYDLLLFDINMPGLDGIELSARTRAAGCTAPIIVVSGRLTSIELDALKQAGVDRVLAKPFGMDELLAALRDAIVRR